METKVPFELLAGLLYYRELFGLSYQQLTRFLFTVHGIKITPQGLRKRLRSMPSDVFRD